MNEGTEELDEPIKIRFTGKFRRKLTEHALEFDAEPWELIESTLSRQKTNIVIKTEDEAESLISKLSGYENGRTWMNASMNKCATRVKTEIQSALEMDNEDEKGGSETEHEEPSAQPVATDGGMPPGECAFIHGKPSEEEDEDEKPAMTDGGTVEESEREMQQKQAITFVRMVGNEMGVSPFDVEKAIQMVCGPDAKGVEALDESELNSEGMELFMNMMDQDDD